MFLYEVQWLDWFLLYSARYFFLVSLNFEIRIRNLLAGFYLTGMGNMVGYVTLPGYPRDFLWKSRGYLAKIPFFWAVSSFGRALPWHGRGEEFDSPTVHFWTFGIFAPIVQRIERSRPKGAMYVRFILGAREEMRFLLLVFFLSLLSRGWNSWVALSLLNLKRSLSWGCVYNSERVTGVEPVS